MKKRKNMCGGIPSGYCSYRMQNGSSVEKLQGAGDGFKSVFI